jgi:hypothetical protein
MPVTRRPSTISREIWREVAYVSENTIYWSNNGQTEKIGDEWWSRIMDGGPRGPGYTLSPDGNYVLVRGPIVKQLEKILEFGK